MTLPAKLPATFTLYTGTTKHSRMEPVAHSFSYPVLYGGLDFYFDSDAQIVHVSRFPWLTLAARDFLGCSLQSLTFKELFSCVCSHLTAEHQSLVYRIHLVSMPRLFGYSFNPVNFFFCYDLADRYLVTLLEVHNTFGEGHVYVLDSRNAVDTKVSNSNNKRSSLLNFDGYHRVKRAFHVSPFNNLDGYYLIGVTEPSKTNKFLVHIVIYDTDPVTGQDYKKLMANIVAARVPKDDTLWTLARYPVTLFLTFPRIVYNAGRLAYGKYLKVYPKPTPYNQDTIQRNYPSSFELFCIRSVIGCLNAKLVDISIKFKAPIGIQLPEFSSAINPFEGSKQINISLNNYDLFVWLVLHWNPNESFEVALTEKGIELDSTSYKMFKQVLSDTFGPLKHNSPVFIQLFRWLISRLVFKDSVPFNQAHPIDIYILTSYSLLNACWWYVSLVGMVSIYYMLLLLFTLITPWADGTDPAPSAQLKRARYKNE